MQGEQAEEKKKLAKTLMNLCFDMFFSENYQTYVASFLPEKRMECTKNPN